MYIGRRYLPICDSRFAIHDSSPANPRPPDRAIAPKDANARQRTGVNGGRGRECECECEWLLLPSSLAPFYATFPWCLQEHTARADVCTRIRVHSCAHARTHARIASYETAMQFDQRPLKLSPISWLISPDAIFTTPWAHRTRRMATLTRRCPLRCPRCRTTAFGPRHCSGSPLAACFPSMGSATRR